MGTDANDAPGSLPRSLLYVPGHREDLFAKAAAGPADAVVLDLEDAVPLGRKVEARASVARWLRDPPTRGPQWWVRVDPLTLADDLEAAVGPALGGILLAKCTPQMLGRSDEELSRLESQRGLAAAAVGVVGLVESAQALAVIPALAQGPRLRTLALGEADLFADLRLTRNDATAAAVDALRVQVVLACAAAGLSAPVAPTSTAYRDLAAFAETSAALRDLGFRSRTAVHPTQVPVINDCFTPSSRQVADSLELLAAFESAEGGATSVRGRLVDAATVRSAREVVARAGHTDDATP